MIWHEKFWAWNTKMYYYLRSFQFFLVFSFFHQIWRPGHVPPCPAPLNYAPRALNEHRSSARLAITAACHFPVDTSGRTDRFILYINWNFIAQGLFRMFLWKKSLFLRIFMEKRLFVGFLGKKSLIQIDTFSLFQVFSLLQTFKKP